jgi:hypothetical protein
MRKKCGAGGGGGEDNYLTSVNQKQNYLTKSDVKNNFKDVSRFRRCKRRTRNCRILKILKNIQF